MRLAVFLAVLLTASTANADRWTATDTASQGAVLSMLAFDYWQTRGVAAKGRESNPIMGWHGELVPPEMYFASVAALHTLAVLALPQPYRRIAQAVTVGVEVGAIGANWRAGFGVAF